jgi:S1-C subfamily serine protease
MNYGKKQMSLKRNRNYKTPFYYNLSGLTLSYDGSIQVKELQDVRSEGLNISKPSFDAYPGQASIVLDPVYSLFTAPKVVVAEIREDSPAARAGLKVGDGIIKINGVYCYKYKMYELTALLSSKVGRKIKVSYERGDILIKTSFVLEKVL